MPTLESLDYERFNFGDEESAKSLSLDEAIKKAAALRREDKQNFYRIEAVDESMNSFRIEKVAISSVYAELLNRLTRTWSHYAHRAFRIK